MISMRRFRVSGTNVKNGLGYMPSSILQSLSFIAQPFFQTHTYISLTACLYFEWHDEMAVVVFFFFARDSSYDHRSKGRTEIKGNMFLPHDCENIEKKLCIELYGFGSSLD